ncbi:macrophage mannose receptor 1-like [Epinephelus lanceolatus]
MEKVLSIIALSGLCAVSSHAERQYHFVYDLKNMTEAQSYCREKYTDLATIDSMEDVTTLINMADRSRMVYSDGYNNRAWIGLYDDVDSWRWSLSDTSYYKDGETEFRQWSSGEPNNEHSGEHCTWMYDSGLWNDAPCAWQYKAVCSDVRGSNVTFVLTDASMTWTEAQSYCRANYTDLTSVRNMTENQKVQELIPAGERVWIGLFRDSWKWLDGSNSSFRYWKLETKEPNNSHGKEACVAADFGQSGGWEDWNCDFERAFICSSVSVPVSKKAMKVMKVRFETQDSSLDMNDPVVMEDILKKLKQRLRHQRLNDDIKLSWRKQPDGKVFHKEEKKTRKKSSPKKDEL